MKEPPRDIKIEQAVLCSILKDGFEPKPAYKPITHDDFYSLAHQRIFEAMLSLNNVGLEYAPLALVMELRKTGKLDTAGGEEYVNSLFDVVPNGANGEYYTELFLDYSVRRQVIKICSDCITSAYDETLYMQDVMPGAIKELRRINGKIKAVSRGKL
jgi:replicative DNA helicase